MNKAALMAALQKMMTAGPKYRMGDDAQIDVDTSVPWMQSQVVRPEIDVTVGQGEVVNRRPPNNDTREAYWNKLEDWLRVHAEET